MRERYNVKHRGTAIICGSAPCVFEDLEKALDLRPEAYLVGVAAIKRLVAAFFSLRHDSTNRQRVNARAY